MNKYLQYSLCPVPKPRTVKLGEVIWARVSGERFKHGICELLDSAV